MRKLTDLLQVRVTAEMTARLKSEAQRLGVRPSDVARMAIARAVTYGTAAELGDRPADLRQAGPASE